MLFICDNLRDDQLLYVVNELFADHDNYKLDSELDETTVVLALYGGKDIGLET